MSAAHNSNRFADWCRSLRGYSPRSYFAPLFGLNERSMQDLEQARSLPSRAVIVLLKAVEMDPDWMRQVAKAAKPELEALEQLRTARNKIG